jgi:hypothetical protein
VRPAISRGLYDSGGDLPLDTSRSPRLPAPTGGGRHGSEGSNRKCGTHRSLHRLEPRAGTEKVSFTVKQIQTAWRAVNRHVFRFQSNLSYIVPLVQA